MASDINISIGVDDNTVKGIGSIKRSLLDLGGIAKNAIGTALGIGITSVVPALVDGLRSVIDEASQAQQGIAQLDAVLQSTGGSAGVTRDAALDLAQSLAGVTRFADDAILGGENLLLTFTNIGSDVFPMATEAMLNMSQAMGQDIKSSAIQLGKALNDPIAGMTALTRVGVTFSDAQAEMIGKMVAVGNTAGAQKVILQELEKEFGNSAKAAGETFAGKLDILNNKFNDLKEAVGTYILPYLTTLVDKLTTDILPAFEKLMGMDLTKIGDALQAWAKSDETQNSLYYSGVDMGNALFDGLMETFTNRKQNGANIIEIIDGILKPGDDAIRAIGAAMDVWFAGIMDLVVTRWKNEAAPRIRQAFLDLINDSTQDVFNWLNGKGNELMPGLNEPITPYNLNLGRQTGLGMGAGIGRPQLTVNIDGQEIKNAVLATAYGDIASLFDAATAAVGGGQ